MSPSTARRRTSSRWSTAATSRRWWPPASLRRRSTSGRTARGSLPDPAEAGFEALRRRGHYPINHLVVIRDDVLEAERDLAANVFDAFAEAKNLYVERLRAGQIDSPTPTDAMYGRVLELTGEDPLPYGIEPN